MNKRAFFADLLRVAATLAVILIHVSSDYVEQWSSLAPTDWWSANVYDALSRWCVPMFVALSGTFLLNPSKEVSLRTLFTKRLPRLVVPLVFWSVVYVCWNTYNATDDATPFDLAETLHTFYEGPVVYHFWYLYMLVGIYLFYPVLNTYLSSASEQSIKYFLLCCFATNTIFGAVELFTDASIGIDLSAFTGYVGYFVLGYYLYNRSFTAREITAAKVMLVLGGCISLVTPYLLFRIGFDAPKVIANDFTIDIVLEVIGLYVWTKSLREPTSERLKSIFGQMSEASFGIYLIHVLLLEGLFQEDAILNLTPLHLPLFATIGIEGIAIFSIGYAIVWLLRLITPLRWIVG